MPSLQYAESKPNQLFTSLYVVEEERSDWFCTTWKKGFFVWARHAPLLTFPIKRVGILLHKGPAVHWQLGSWERRWIMRRAKAHQKCTPNFHIYNSLADSECSLTNAICTLPRQHGTLTAFGSYIIWGAVTTYMSYKEHARINDGVS